MPSARNNFFLFFRARTSFYSHSQRAWAGLGERTRARGYGRDAMEYSSYKKYFFSEPYLEEMLVFIHFLKGKASKERMETAILSESVLAKDWLSPEEDEAWKNL
jgi:hypothetical protein